MFATLLIVFRESLEAALFIGIIAAATRTLPRRGRWLSAGVGAGVFGALVLALLASRLNEWLDGRGQDAVNIAVLSVALAMLLWHCVWVTTHTREMVADARRIGEDVQAGQRTPWALAIVAAMAVLREGAETVLFVSGSLTGGGAVGASTVLLATTAGLLLGAAVGAGIYVGLKRVPARYVFSATNGLIALLAASLASQLARALAQAGLVERWTEALWDSSTVLPPQSAVGTLLHGLVGYDAQPSGLQLAAYAGVLAFIYAGPRLLQPRRRPA